MNEITRIIKENIIHRDFVYLEIAKRHLEEKEPAIINELVGFRDRLTEIMAVPQEEKSHFFLCVMGEAIDFLYAKNNNIRPPITDYTKSMEARFPKVFNFEDREYHNICSRMLEISQKYNIHASTILYPIDMHDILNIDFKMPNFYRFNTNKNDNFSVIKDKSEIKFLTKEILSISDVYDMMHQVVVSKILCDQDLEQIDNCFINAYYQSEANTRFRTDTFMKYIFGLLLWDAKKESKNIKDLYSFYCRYQRTVAKNSDCKGRKESIDNDCAKFQKCTRYVNEAFRLVSLCIEKNDILDAKTKGDACQPKSQIFIERKKMQFFYGNSCG